MKTKQVKLPRSTPKMRFILLNIAALLFVLIGVGYLDYAGDAYAMETHYYFADTIVEDVDLICDNNNLVELTDWSLDDDDQLILDLQSLEAGKTDARFFVTDADGEVYESSVYHLTVNGMGTIIADYYGLVNFSGFRVMLWLFFSYLGLVLIVMIISYIDCVRTSDYSYRMISYGGIALILAVMLAILLYKLFNNVVDCFTNLLGLVISAVEWYLILMFLPMAVLAIAVSISNIRLMTREGFRPVNALGIAMSLVWLLGLVGYTMIYHTPLPAFREWEHAVLASKVLSVIHYTVAYTIAYFESMLLSTALSAMLASRHTPPYDRDYIIILGCAIRSDGSLTPLLRGRVDSALHFEQRQYEQTGRHARFVPSGGQGSDECISEGEAMERYLLSQGVESERILCEDKSVNTFENMQFSKAVIEKDAADIGDKKIAFATTNYHIFRGYILSKQNGFGAQGISAKTKWYFFPNAFLREFIGLLYDQKLRHLGVFIFIILMSVLPVIW